MYAHLAVELGAGWKQVWVSDNNIVKLLRSASSWIGRYINVTCYYSYLHWQHTLRIYKKKKKNICISIMDIFVIIIETELVSCQRDPKLLSIWFYKIVYKVSQRLSECFDFYSCKRELMMHVINYWYIYENYPHSIINWL